MTGLHRNTDGVGGNDRKKEEEGEDKKQGEWERVGERRISFKKDAQQWLRQILPLIVFNQYEYNICPFRTGRSWRIKVEQETELINFSCP